MREYAIHVKKIMNGMRAVSVAARQAGPLQSVLREDDTIFKESFANQLRVVAQSIMGNEQEKAALGGDPDSLLAHARDILSGKLPADLNGRIALYNYLMNDSGLPPLDGALRDQLDHIGNQACERSVANIEVRGFKKEAIEFLQEGEIDAPWAPHVPGRNFFKIPVSSISGPANAVKTLFTDCVNIYFKADYAEGAESDAERQLLQGRVVVLRRIMEKVYAEVGSEIFPGLPLAKLDYPQVKAAAEPSGKKPTPETPEAPKEPIAEKPENYHTGRLSKSAAVSYDNPQTPGKQSPGWEWP